MNVCFFVFVYNENHFEKIEAENLRKISGTTSYAEIQINN